MQKVNRRVTFSSFVFTDFVPVEKTVRHQCVVQAAYHRGDTIYECAIGGAARILSHEN